MRKLISFIIILFATVTTFAATASQQFLMLSDFHFDPFYACETSNQPTCTLATKLNAATPSGWSDIFKQYGSKTLSDSGYDTNYALLQSTLKAAKADGKSNNIAFVAIDGDFLAHHLQSKYQTYLNDSNQKDYQGFVKKEFQFLTSTIQAAFPGKTIIPVLGNNDSYNGDYFVWPNGDFFKDMSNTWGTWFQNSQNRAAFQSQFSGTTKGEDGGYYAFNLNPNLKIVVVDSTYFSTKRVEPSNVSGESATMLTWLSNTLNTAQTDHQNVWIMMHIPNGINVYDSTSKNPVLFWKAPDNQNFLNLVKGYTNIKMIFVSHTHDDALRIITANKQMAIPEMFNPAISPVHGNYPAFKIYSFDPTSGNVENVIAYHLNAGIWSFEYDFDKAYQTDNLYDGIKKLIFNKGILNNAAFGKNYENFYASGAPSPINSSNIRHYFCGAIVQGNSDFNNCWNTPSAHK